MRSTVTIVVALEWSHAIISFVRDRRTRSSPDLDRPQAAEPEAAALDSAPVGVFRNAADGACIYVNDRWCEYAGMARADAMGWGWLDAVHPDDLERVQAEWAASVAEGRDFELEFRFGRPGGETMSVAGTATALRDASGAVTGYIGTLTNISAAVAARLALIDEREFMDTVLDIAGSLVCVIDPEGRFLRFNRACELLSGWTFEEIRGRPLYEFLVPADEIEAVRTDLARLRAGEPPAPNTNSWVTRSGALRLISWLDVCFFDAAGQLTHVVSTGTDVTDERRAQAALRGVEAAGTLLAKHGPTPEAMAKVLQTLADEMGYRYIALFMCDGDRLHVAAELGYGDRIGDFDLSAGIVGRAFRTGDASLVADVSLDPDYVVGDPAVTSEIAAPLLANDAAIGVLSIEARADAPLMEADLRLAQAIAERLSMAVELGREQQALAARARLFAALTAFAGAANATLDTKQMIPTLLEAIGTVLPAEVTVLIVVDRATGRYTVRAARGGLDEAAMIGKEITLSEGITGRAMSSRTIVLDRLERAAYAPGVRDLVTADRWRWRRSRSSATAQCSARSSSAGSPMRDPGFSAARVRGDVAARRPDRPRPRERPVRGGGLRAGRARPLTGLYNRRHFDAALEHILRRYVRTKGARPPVAAIMFDLDHFGRFNKDHGHQAGDEVLRTFAGILLERFRSSDLVARYGGEEFVAVLEGSTVAEAVVVAEDIRRTLAAVRIPGFGGVELRATVSAGSAALDDADPTREALIRAADVGLFMAKRAGRNQVVAV